MRLKSLTIFNGEQQFTFSNINRVDGTKRDLIAIETADGHPTRVVHVLGNKQFTVINLSVVPVFQYEFDDTPAN